MNFHRRLANAVKDPCHGLLGKVTALGYDRALTDMRLRLEDRKSPENLRELLALEDKSAVVPSFWRDLGPFAYELIKERQPRVVVELGSYGGYSTCVMGLALKRHVPGAALYAVDTWQGDGNTGVYGEKVFAQFQSFRSTLGLEEVIRPLRMTFNEAKTSVPDGIDLLHIDGWHTFKAVREDFQSFLPKLAPGALVLFHDVNTFFTGMRLFWLMATLRYRTSLVPYSHGLGLLQIPARSS